VDAVYGWADKYGVDVEQIDLGFEEVHRSNMGKFWSHDEVADKPTTWTAEITYADAYIVKDETGKVRKSPSWTEPKLNEVLA
jgi:predicted HAD superfamily Cof-like phosphohydrolase